VDWIKSWVFQLLGIGFAGRRRVLRAMRKFVEAGVDKPFKPRGQFSFGERLAMAFFCTLIRSPLAAILLLPVFVLAGLTLGLQALGFLV
jgi:hypothetical protein